MSLLERDAESAALDDALASAARGEGIVALVSGEAGIGKTALVRDFARRSAERARLLWGMCDDLSTPRILGPLRDIAPTVGAELADALSSALAPVEIFGLVRDELRRPPVPVVFVVEDVHWADQSTVDLIGYLGRRLHALPAVLLLTYRSDELDRGHPLVRALGRIPVQQTVRLNLAPLSVLAADVLAPGRGAEIHHISGGNPFFVTELAASGSDLPGSVVDAVLARTNRLPEESRNLLDLIGVSPTPVETAILDRCAPDWAGAAVVPEARGIVILTDDALGFRHELGRKAVAGQISVSRAAELHRILLAAMVDLPADLPIDRARLVHHAAAAHDDALLLRFGLAAAQDAARHSANREAAQHFARVEPHLARLTAHEHADVLEQWAMICMLVGDLERAATLADRALTMRRADTDVEGIGRLLRFKAQLSWPLGRPDDAERFSGEAVEVLSRLEPGRELAYVYVERAGRAMTEWRDTDATAFGRRAADLAERIGADDLLALALIFMATVRLERGEAVTTAIERAVRLAAGVGDHHTVCVAYGNMADTAIEQRDHDLARHVLDLGCAYADEHEVLSVLDYMTGVRSRVELSAGRWADAEKLADSVLTQGEASFVNQVNALTTVVQLAVRRGDPSAGDLVHRLDAVTLKSGELQRQFPAAVARAEWAELRGQLGGEHQHLRSLLDRMVPSGRVWPIGETAVWVSRAATDRAGSAPGRGRPPVADVLPPAVADTLPEPCRAELLGRHEAAAAAWNRLGCPYEAADALARSGAVDLMLAAVGSFDDLGATAAAARTRSILSSLGVRGVPRGPLRETRSNPAGLTGRQLDVLKAMAGGSTNVEIAERLTLSVRTVDHHVSAILAKLGVASRREAIAEARELGLTSADD